MDVHQARSGQSFQYTQQNAPQVPQRPSGYSNSKKNTRPPQHGEEALPSFNKWKKEQLKVFSQASEETSKSKAAPSSAHECTSGPEPSHTSFAREVVSVMAEANHSYFQKMHSTKDRPAVASETTNKHLGLAKSSFELIIIYCGLVAGEEDSIPSIWYQLAEDRLSPADKRGKARRWM